MRGLDGAALSGDYVNDPTSPKNGFAEIWPNVLERAIAMWNDDPVNKVFDGQGNDQAGYGGENGLDTYGSPAVIWEALTGQNPDVPDLADLGMSLADYVHLKTRNLGQQAFITTLTEIPGNISADRPIKPNHIYIVVPVSPLASDGFYLYNVTEPELGPIRISTADLPRITKALTVA